MYKQNAELTGSDTPRTLAAKSESEGNNTLDQKDILIKDGRTRLIFFFKAHSS